LGTVATTGLLYQPRMICDGDCGEIGGIKISRGNRSTRRIPAPAPLLSVTKSHMTRPGLNPGCRGGKPATNCLSYGAALETCLSQKLDLILWAYDVFYDTFRISDCTKCIYKMKSPG
jgi:hypothetical protein